MGWRDCDLFAISIASAGLERGDDVLTGRRLAAYALAAAVAAWLPAQAATAADDTDLRRQLETLNTQIEHINDKVAETDKKAADLKAAIAEYEKKVEANRLAQQEIKQAGDDLAARGAKLNAERGDIVTLCRQKVDTEKEYHAAVAACETAGKRYQGEADALRADREKLEARYAAANQARSELTAEYEQLQRQSTELQEERTALQQQREQDAARFNEIREQLVARLAPAK